MPITPEEAKRELARRELARRQQAKQATQQPKQNILQQLLGATENTVGGIVGGIIEPPTKIIGRAGQAIESMVSGKPPQEYSIPLPNYMGGNIDIKPAQNAGQLLMPVAGTALSMAGLKGLLNPKGLSKVLNYENALKRSETAKSALDELRTTVGKAKQLAIQEVADVPVTVKPIGKNVPKLAIDEIMKPEHNVEFLTDGSLKPTIGNMDKVKDALGDLIGNRPMAWKEASKAAKKQIINTYFEVRDLMIEGGEKVGKDLSKPLEAYHKFMINYNKINPALIDKNNQIVANKLKDAFKWSAEPAYKKAWQEVSKTSPEIKSVMNSMNRRELLANLLKISGIGGAVALSGKGAMSLLQND